MTLPTPLSIDTSLVTFSVKSDGKPIPDTMEVISIDTWIATNKVPKARLVLFDGSPAERTFPISSLPTFLPGKKIEIAVGYNSNNAVIFRGVVVSQGIEINQNEGSKLIVEITDEAMKMTLNRRNAIFEKIKDGDLIGKLITTNGLSKDVAATDTVHEEIVQYYATDWDLMVMRAEMNGLVVMADGGKVTVKPPDTSQTPVLLVEYGVSILDLNAEMDAATQFAPSAIKSYGWDSATQKLVEAGPGTVNVTEPGNVSSAQLAKVFNVAEFPQQSAGPIEKTSLQDWSAAELLKSKLSKIRGSVRFQGSTKVAVGKMLQLGGLGDRFNGKVFMSSVHHSIHDGIWLTTVDFGLSPKWFAAVAPNVAEPNASFQLPPIRGLQTGVVKKIAPDPGGEYRVLVSLPLLQDNAKGIWARLGTFYGSNKVGAFFYPEVGDEVVVAFLNEDPRYPVILGSLYSKKLPPPSPPEDKNNRKAIVTRSKMEISFDEMNKIILLKTPGGHSIKMDDKTGAISIQDSNNNTVSLSKGGITLDSASNIKITAKGNITVQAGANLALSAKANASMEGLQVAHKAKAKFSANGAAAAELTASGILTVRGAIVKIN